MAILRWLDENLEEILLMIFLVVMVGVMGVQVFMRYLLNASLSWSEELTRYLFVWSAFISTSYCIRKDASIKIDQITTMLPPTSPVRKTIEITVKLIMLAFFSYLFYYSIDVVAAGMRSGQRSPAIGIPMYMIQISTAVGFALSVVRLIQSLLRGSKPPIDPDEKINLVQELVEEVKEFNDPITMD